MCILLKLNYAKFSVSKLFFSKVMEEKPLGRRLDPLGQEGLRCSFASKLFFLDLSFAISVIVSSMEAPSKAFYCFSCFLIG